MAGNLTAMIAAAFSGGASPPVTTDPYFDYTTLLLPGNGTNGAQNNTFLDGSTNNFTITRNGNTTQGTFSPFSQTGWSNYFDGSGDSLTLTGVNLSSGNWTIECFVYIQSFATTLPHIFSIGTDGNNRFALYRNSATSKFNFVTVNSGVHVSAESTTAPTVGQWYHVAVVSNSGTRTLYVNGAAEVTSTTAINNGTSYSIGNLQFTPVANDPLTGYISNFRVVTSAVYTGNFTPPTSPLTAITNTALLTCQSNRFIDTNTQAAAKTITRNGDTRVVAFSPFNPTASWSAATYGGSGYFDGSGDYLNTASDAAFTLGSSGDFTVEMFFYAPAAQATNAILVSTMNNGTSDFANRWGIQFATSTTLGWYNDSGSNGITSGTVVLSQWNHLAVCRSGSTIRMWLNGVSQGTQTTLQAYTTQGSVKVGFLTGLAAFSGYISNVRVVKGTAVYDASSSANITVPTAPLTAITNTSLLLNYTNAGIYDATSKNDLETVGNAQISTTQSKWGGSSISFDGTGDWLLIPDQPPQRIGTGNFTVEMWVYRNSSGTYGLAGKGTGTTGWLVSLNSSNQVVFTYGSSTITSSGTVSATTWTHIAVVREGTSTNQTKIYINGTNDGTGTVSTDFNQTNSMYIGADRTGGSAANAYVQDVRITNYARYTANFTAPTAAFPTL